MLLPGAGLLPENVSQVNTQGIILFKRQPLLLADSLCWTHKGNLPVRGDWQTSLAMRS